MRSALCRSLCGAVSLMAAPSFSADLCQGLVRDPGPRPLSALAKPAPGEAVRDPRFGTVLRRITSVTPPASGDAAIVPLYSTVSAWNADESLLLLYHVGHGHELYDGRTYTFLRSLPIAPTDLEQVYWHTTDPDVLLFPNGNRLMRYRVATERTEIVRTFTFCSSPVSAGSDPMFTSWDSNVIGLKCGTTAFLYRIDRDQILASAATSLDPPQAAPSGQRALYAGWVVDTAFRAQGQLDLANPYEHASLGRLADGRDAYHTVAFDPGPAGSGVGSLVTFDLANGASRVVVGPQTGWPYPPGGTHVSGLAYRAPGWVYLSIVGNPAAQRTLDGEIVLANADTGAVCRAAHHRSHGSSNARLQTPYWAEPHVVASPSGTRALFASDWGGGATVDTYVVELPSDAGLTLGVRTDRSSYRRGQTMTGTLSLSATRPASADILLCQVLPDGDQAACLTPSGPRPGRLSRPSTLVPLAAALTLMPPANVNAPFVSYTWTGNETAGGYRWVGLAVRPGSLADDRLDPGDLLSGASASWTFTP